MAKNIISKDFFAFQWSVKSTDDFTHIHIHGCDKDGKRVYVVVNDFYYSLCVELPGDIEWTGSSIELVKDSLKKISKSFESEVIYRKKLYYAWKEFNPDLQKYEDKTFPFIRFKFKTQKYFNIFRSLIKKPIDIRTLGKFEFKTHEDDSTELYLKLFSVRNLPACGVISVRGELVKEENKTSRSEFEMIASYKNISPSNSTEIYQPTVLSFDIEANSTITSAMPNCNRPDDKVFQVSAVLRKKKKIKKYLLSLGEPDLNIVGKDVEIRSFRNEADLLVGFRDLVVETKTHIVIGYNILGWDFKYMINRAQYTKCISEFDTMGIVLYDEEGKQIHDPIIEPKESFKTKAYSAQKLVYLDSEGILYIDLLPVIKRSEKLKNYRLDTVTAHYGLPGKDPLKAKDIFKCYRDFTPQSLGTCGKYCVQDAYITLLLYEKTQQWYGLCEMSKTAQVPIFFLFSKGTQIQMFSQVLKYCNANNYIVISNGYTPKEGDEYAGAIVLTPVPGKYKKVLSFDFASLYPSIMRAHNIDYSTFIYEGEHYLVDSFDKDYYKKWTEYPCHLKLSIPQKNIENWITIYDENDLVDNVERLKKEYPNVLLGIFKEKSKIPDKHCHVFSWVDHQNCVHDLNRKKLKNGEFSTAKVKVICGQRYYRFINQEFGGKGVVPILLEDLINRRKETRGEESRNKKEIRSILIRLFKNLSQQKEVKDFLTEFETTDKEHFEDIQLDVEKANSETMSLEDGKRLIERIRYLTDLNFILDSRQKSYKICANSMYGAMGVKKGYLPLGPGASSVTYRGRCAIEFISTYIPQNYGGVTVYGDTDSSHIYFPHIKNNKDAVELADKIVDKMQEFFPKPMKLEFEKIYEDYIILTKKRYMARVANRLGEIIDFTKRGIILSRRDNCTAVRNIYQELADMLLENKERNDILNRMTEMLDEVFCRKYNYKNFVIPKQLTKDVSEYDTGKTIPAHAQLAKRMIERGIEVVAGSRLEYVFTTRCQLDKNVIQGEKIEDIDYYTNIRQYLGIDYLYYMETQFIKPLDELLKVGLGVEDFFKKQYQQRVLKLKVCKEIENLFSPSLELECDISDVKDEVSDEKEEKKVVKKRKEKKVVPNYTITRYIKPVVDFDEDTERIKKEIEEKKKLMNL